MKFSPAQLHVIEGALRVAERVYRDDAADTPIPRLKDQFERQAREAADVLDFVENDGVVTKKRKPRDGQSFAG